MNELFHTAFHVVNLIPTILLLLVVIYWLLVVLGTLDLGLGEFDIEPEIEVEAGTDMAEAGGEINASSGLFNEVLSFFNLGKVPFMVFMTALVLPMWFISMNVTYYFGIGSFLISLIVLAPNFIFSLFLAKILTIPFVGIFRRLHDEAMHKDELIGKSCIVTLTCNSDSIGQVEVKISGDSFILNAKTRDGIELPKGSSAVVVERIVSSDYFIVAPF